MPLDGVCLQAVLEELRPRLLGLRIDKVQQPARDQIILLLRGNLKLLLNAGSRAPRIQLTEIARENPAEPPMFCMLLRKHLVGGRIAAVIQPPLERMVRLELEITDAFGQPGRRSLILESAGRRSNLILLDEEERIIDCLRRVDAEMSAQRQILPGLYYEPPKAPDKLVITEETESGFQTRFNQENPERQISDFLLGNYFGISPLIARELAFRASGEIDRRIFQLDRTERAKLWNIIQDLVLCIQDQENHDNNYNYKFRPYCLYRDNQAIDFSYLDIQQYGSTVKSVVYSSFSELMDAFFVSLEQQERLKQKGADLLRTVSTARDRLRRKLALQERDYAATQNRDRLRLNGDFIMANLYQIERGQAYFRAKNFYEPELPEVQISLDPLLTPQQNAAKYYKRYQKAKTAEQHLSEQMAIARRDLDYLESVLEELNRAESEQDFIDIREELRQSGFLRKQSGKKQRKKELSRPAKPWHFETSGGFHVFVGRNNRQNDQLTMRDAEHRDLWFHTQKIHGSHVILRTDGQIPDKNSVQEAALLAAWFSQGRESSGVPVDYTEVKHVKKPAGARPGMVLYTNFKTLYITPNESEIKALRQIS